MGGQGNKVGMNENIDHLDDARLARRWNRRSFTSNSLKTDFCNLNVQKTFNNVKKKKWSVDPQYDSFLNGFLGSADQSADDDGDDDVHDDDKDSQYDIFLKHLREVGTSYFLDIAIDDEISFVVKYEIDDDDFKGKTLKNAKGVSCEAKAKAKAKAKRVLRSNMHREKKETPVTLRSAFTKQNLKVVSSEEKAKTKRILNNVKQEEKEETPITLSDSSRGRKRSVVERDAEAKCRTKDFQGKTLKKSKDVSCEAKAKTKRVLRSHLHQKRKETPATLRSASSKQKLKVISSGHKAETKRVVRNVVQEETPITVRSDSSGGRKRSVIEKDAEAKCRENDFQGKTLKNSKDVSCVAKTKRVLRSNMPKDKKETPVTLRSASSKQNLKVVSSGDKAGTKRIFRNVMQEETPITLRNDSSRGIKRSVIERDAEAKCRANDSPSLKHGSKVQTTSKPDSNHETETDMVDEIYADFLMDAEAKCGANDSSSLKPGSKVQTTSKPDSNQETGTDMEDDSYADFLNFLKEDGDTMVLTSKDGKQIRYESDDESLSDSDTEIVVTDKVPYYSDGKYTPFVISKTYYSDCNGTSGRSNSEFRERLMDVLQKPFDQKEYQLLLQEASMKKLVERDRELRGSVKRYSLEISSRSYLEHYTDFAKRIDSVRCNRHRVLNLLRGFFYWLKNLTQEGAFRPWLDESCI